MGSSHPRKPRGYQPGRCNIFERAIFSGESLPQELTEPVPEAVEYRPADWAEKYFSAQSARSASRVTLSPSYTRQFSSSINLLTWPVQRNGKVVVESFRKKKFNEAEEIASLKMGARNQYSSINFLGGFIESIAYIFIAYVRDFYTVAFACGETQSSTQGYFYFSSIVEQLLKLCMICKSPLHGPRNYVDPTWERSADSSPRPFSCSCYRAKPKISQQHCYQLCWA